MSILEFVYHRHYWSIPHRRESDNWIIQTCYDCGKDRESRLIIGETSRFSSTQEKRRNQKRRNRLWLPWRAQGCETQNQAT